MPTKEDYHFLLSRGLCPQCGGHKVLGDYARCADCLYKMQMYHIKRTQEMTESERLARNEKAREKAMQYKLEGRCICCGEKKPKGDARVHCPKCRARINGKKRERNRPKKKGPGICRFCDQPSRPGYKTCEKCGERCAAALEKGRKVLEENYAKYGKKNPFF